MKIGRNELCYCGSGKKYKKCCMNKEKRIEEIEDIQKLNEIENLEDMNEIMNRFQYMLLKNKPHIKEYRKIRRLHKEIIDSMMKYHDDGKFEFKATGKEIENKILNDKNAKILDCDFDTNTQLGGQAWGNILVYKNSKTMNCITEEYIKLKKFRKPEKIEFLNSMLNSEATLFEITKTDRTMGQVHLKNVFSDKEICLTDIGLSSNFFNEEFYIYMRVITYNNVSFGTGLSLAFRKSDKFIQKWIDENSKNYNKDEEAVRFIELYNKYKSDNEGIRVRLRAFE